MLAAIRQIKADGPTAETRETLSAAADELTGQGAAVLLVACSGFFLHMRDLSSRIPVIDTIDVLARAIHAHSQPH